MKVRKGDRQYYLNKEGDTFHLVKRVKTFSKSATLGKTKATVITVADLIFHEDAFDTIDFTRGGLRENDKEVVSMMIQEMNNEREKMLTENTPENIKRLRQKIGLTQRECAEIFSMNPRTWRRKEEPAGTASGTALTPVEFKYLQLLAGEHPEYVLRKRDKPKCSE